MFRGIECSVQKQGETDSAFHKLFFDDRLILRHVILVQLSAYPKTAARRYVMIAQAKCSSPK